MEYNSTHTGAQIDSAVDDVINNKERWNNPSASNVCFADGENIQQKYDNGQLGVSSWNDLTDKPFYEEKGEPVEILPESQMVYDEEGFFVLESVVDLVIGKTYTINWNGTEYKSVAIDGTALGETGAIVLGDVYTASDGAVGTESTGEPFVVITSIEQGITVAIPLDGSASVTISIYTDGTVIKPIDGKFLPKGTPWVEEGGRVEILPDYTITEENMEADMAGIPRLGLVAGNTYTVKLQGTEYTCVACEVDHPDTGTVVGLGDLYTATEGMMGSAATGEPFALMELSPEVAAQAGINVTVQPLVEMEFPVVFSIYGRDVTVHKLDNRCLDLDWLPTVNYQTVVPLGEYDNNTQVGGAVVLVPDANVKVTYDGTLYDLTVYANAGNENYFYVGNKRLFFETLEDTGEPFLFVNVTEAAALAIMFADGNPHSVSLEVRTVNKAPAELLPYASETEDGIMKAVDKVKLDSVEEGANHYIHPTFTSRDFGFYKFQVNGEGHVTSAVQVSDAVLDATTKPGKMVAGENFTIGEEEVTASSGAEIFNLVGGESDNIATGYCSHAEGDGTTASNFCAHAEGSGTTASKPYSHAEGTDTTASGDASHAEGRGTEASASYSHAEGYATKAMYQNSHAEGSNTTASGDASHAEGAGTEASASYSHAEGKDTKATAQTAHAEGNRTTASSDFAHAEGSNTNATGMCSHTEGFGTTASGYYAHAEGSDTTASGDASHAEGTGTIASGQYQHVQGYYNIEDAQYLHIVGNGTADDDRKNAHTIDRYGNGWFAGGVSCEGNVVSGGDVVCGSIMLRSSTPGSTKKFWLFVSDDGTIAVQESTV